MSPIFPTNRWRPASHAIPCTGLSRLLTRQEPRQRAAPAMSRFMKSGQPRQANIPEFPAPNAMQSMVRFRSAPIAMTSPTIQKCWKNSRVVWIAISTPTTRRLINNQGFHGCSKKAPVSSGAFFYPFFLRASTVKFCYIYIMITLPDSLNLISFLKTSILLFSAMQGLSE